LDTEGTEGTKATKDAIITENMCGKPFVAFVPSVPSVSKAYLRIVRHLILMIPGKDYVGLGVGALIVRNGKVLMLLRTDACRNNQGMWTIPGGMVEPFERLEDAVKREVKEETGLTVTSPEFMTVSDRTFDDEHWVSILYRCDTEGEPVNMEPDKHREIAWHDLNVLPELITAPSWDAIDAFRICNRCLHF
jgi:8-oxo-dGTP diphosphatase